MKDAPKKFHFLGICGTGMGAVAVARQVAGLTKVCDLQRLIQAGYAGDLEGADWRPAGAHHELVAAVNSKVPIQGGHIVVHGAHSYFQPAGEFFPRSSSPVKRWRRVGIAH